MRITEKTSEVKRFIRATKDAFEAQTAGARVSDKGYMLSFAVALAQPTNEANASLVKSYLESLAKAVSAFSSTDMLSVQLDIIDQGSFEHKLVEETRQNFEASQKLEGKVPQGPTIPEALKAVAEPGKG